MAKKNTARTKTAVATVTSTVTAPVPTPPPAAPTAPALAPALDLAAVVADLPDGFRVPVYLAPFRDALRAVAAMPSKTRDERERVRDAFVKAMDAALPGVGLPAGRHTGRWSGMPVFESQNAIYLAAVLANVAIDEGHIMAAWRAELPNAKCDYLGKNYAWSTLSEYVNGRHNGSTIPGAVAAVIAWTKRGRKPLA